MEAFSRLTWNSHPLPATSLAFAPRSCHLHAMAGDSYYIPTGVGSYGIYCSQGWLSNRGRAFVPYDRRWHLWLEGIAGILPESLEGRWAWRKREKEENLWLRKASLVLVSAGVLCFWREPVGNSLGSLNIDGTPYCFLLDHADSQLPGEVVINGCWWRFCS